MSQRSKNKKGYVDRSESFDEFLEKDGLLVECENAALKEISADQIAPPRSHVPK